MKELETNQSTIASDSGAMKITKARAMLSHTEKVQRAEILEALRTVECNHSFRSANELYHRESS